MRSTAFLRHLDASALAALFAGVQDRAHREGREPPPLHLKPFANNLARFASAVRLSRPNEAFLAAHLLLARIDGVEGEVAADLPVLRPLIERIGRLAPIAEDEPALDDDLLRAAAALRSGTSSTHGLGTPGESASGGSGS